MSTTNESSSPGWREGGCHCGAVRFRLRARSLLAHECNCSICTKKGFVGLDASSEDFELISGEEGLVTYRFNTETARHRFCRRCGVHSFSRPRSDPDGFDVNLRCLDGGFEDFEIYPFDGQHWEESIEALD